MRSVYSMQAPIGSIHRGVLPNIKNAAPNGGPATQPGNSGVTEGRHR